MPYGHASMFLFGEGSEATEPYNKYDKIRLHSIRSLQFDQKVRPLSFRPEKFDLFTATPFPLGLCSCSTSLSKMGIKAAPRGREALKDMRTYPRHASCFASFLHYWSYRFSSIPEFYKLVYYLGFVFGFLQTG